MTLAESAVFGMLQGVLEWLPISSTGELVIIMTGLFGYAPRDAADLSFFLHLGTAGSAVLYLRRDIARILRSARGYRPGYGNPADGMITFLVISTLLSGALGFSVFALAADAGAASGEFLLGLVGIALIATGIILYATKRRQGPAAYVAGLKSAASLTFRDTILLGVVQAFSALPGLSRSGVTVSALLLRGYSAPEALRLSFLMGIPAVLTAQAGLLLVYGLPDAEPAELVVGLALSFAFGYLSMRVLVGIAGRVSFWWFAIIMGCVALLSFAGLF